MPEVPEEGSGVPSSVGVLAFPPKADGRERAEHRRPEPAAVIPKPLIGSRGSPRVRAPVLALVLTLVAAWSVVLVAPAAAQGGEVAFTLETHTEGAGGYFTLEGETQRNPTLRVPAGATVTITIKGTDDGVHNFCLKDAKTCTDYLQAAGDTQTLTFTAPASGSIQYFCLPHKAAGMTGQIQTEAAGADGATSGESGEPPTPAGPVSLTLVTHTEGGGGYFTLEGQTQRNPALNVPPGVEVTITLIAGDSNGVHNFCYKDANTCTDYVQNEGDRQTLTFTSATSGSADYFCLPHRAAGMTGKIVVQTSGGQTPGGDDGQDGEAISGETVDLGDLGYPECAGTPIPAIATRGVVGAPVVRDYVEQCQQAASGGPPTEIKRRSSDYLVPVSAVLIALGVVGVVWAHRWYKP